MADNFFKVRNGVNLGSLSADPSNGANGDTYYNTSTNTVRQYVNGAWRDCVETNLTQTLTNKTLSGNTATNLVNGSGTFNINSAGTVTAPNATDTLVGKATTDVLTNKTLSGNTATNLVNSSGTFNFNSSGTITAPNATDTLVGKATTDTLSNKTLQTLVGAVVTDSSTTGSSQTLPSGDIAGVVVSLTNSSLVSISGITAGSSGQHLVVENNTGSNITINNDDSGATAANRIYTGTNGSVSMANHSTFTFTYDTTNSRWMLTGGTGSGTSSSVNYITFGNAESGTQGWATYNENKTATFTNGSSTIGITSNTGYAVGQRISLTTTGTLPTNFSPNTTYYVVSLVSTTGVTVSATQGGTAISAGSAGSGTHTLHPMDPIAGTGGAVSGLTFSTSTSSPLRGNNSYTLVQTNSTVVQGQGVSYDFTIDNEDQAKILSIQIDYNASSTFVASSGQTGSDSDLEVYLYDKTNAVLIPVSPKVITANGSNNFTFKGVFQTASNSTSYRLIVHSVTSNANATGWTFKFDNVQVGPQAIVQGSPVTDWQSYTLTVGAVTTPPTPGTGATSSAMWRRVGDSMEITYEYHQTAAGSAGSGAYLFPIPAGYTIDTSKATVTTNTTGATATALGGGYLTTATSTASGVGLVAVVHAYNTTNVLMNIANGTATGQYQAFGQGASFDFTNTTLYFSFTIKVPIAGWSSTTVMSQDTDTRVVDLWAQKTGTQAVTSNTTDIIFDLVKRDSHGTYNSSTGVYTVPVSGDYFVNATAPDNASSNTQLKIYKNGVSLNITGSLVAGQNSIVLSLVTGLVAGDTLSIRDSQSHTVGASGNFSITRLSGPAAIAATESVNARYFACSTALTSSDTTMTYTTKDYDSHNAYSGGTYTIPSSGKYQINAALFASSTLAANSSFLLSIYKNGVQVSQNGPILGTFASAATVNSWISDEVSCVAGDLITIRAQFGGSGQAVQASNVRNYFSIFRTGN